MKTTTTMSITAKEIRAVAKYQDAIDNVISGFSSEFGLKNPIQKITNLDKAKIALGGDKVIAGELCDEGVCIKWHITINKKGISLELSLDADPKIMTKMFKAYTDIFVIYANVATSTIHQIRSANKLVESRLASL